MNCPFCEKKYDNRGWLPKHIKQHHENTFLLDNNMTYIQAAALDESCQAAGLNNPKNPFWEESVPNSPLKMISSTPRPAQKVPLCQNAETYIVQKGKTLPASFLATLLPAPGFLEELNDSLREPLNQFPSSHVATLHLPTSPQLDWIPSSSVSDTVLEPLQIHNNLQLDPLQHKDSELDSLSQWAGTNLPKASVNILASPGPVCPPVVQLDDSISELPRDLAEIPNPAISSLGDYLQFICGSVLSQGEMILELKDVGRRQNKLIHQLEDKVAILSSKLRSEGRSLILSQPSNESSQHLSPQLKAGSTLPPSQPPFQPPSQPPSQPPKASCPTPNPL